MKKVVSAAKFGRGHIVHSHRLIISLSQTRGGGGGVSEQSCQMLSKISPSSPIQRNWSTKRPWPGPAHSKHDLKCNHNNERNKKMETWEFFLIGLVRMVCRSIGIPLVDHLLHPVILCTFPGRCFKWLLASNQNLSVITSRPVYPWYIDLTRSQSHMLVRRHYYVCARKRCIMC